MRSRTMFEWLALSMLIPGALCASVPMAFGGGWAVDAISATSRSIWMPRLQLTVALHCCSGIKLTDSSAGIATMINSSMPIFLR